MVINISFGARLGASRDFSLESPVEASAKLTPHPVAAAAPTQLPAQLPVGLSAGLSEDLDAPGEAARKAEDVAADADPRDIGRRLQTGDAAVLSQLYDAHGPGLFRLLAAMLGSRADAEDALQELFVKVAARGARGHLAPRFGALGGVRDWRAYLLAAARNEALSVLRRRGRESQMDQEADWDLLPDAGSNALVEASARGSQAHDWPRLLARLPLEQREVVVLKVWEQLTFAQIAHVVGVSPNTAMSRYRYAIERLRAWCQQAAREEADHE